MERTTRRVRIETGAAAAVVAAALLLAATSDCSVERRPPVDRRGGEATGDPWLGETPPDSLPVLFAPGLVSTRDDERDAAWSPDGREFFYTQGSPRPALVRIRMEGRRWGRPEIARFSGRHSDLEPAFSADGRRVYFASNRPRDGEGEAEVDFDLWVAERSNGIWSEPRNLGEPINTPGNEFYPSVSRDGTLAWTAEREGGFGGEDIWIAAPAGRGFADPRPLPAEINTPGPEFNACLSPDGATLVFGGYGRPDGVGGGDLYASSRRPDGSWSPSRNLGPTVNTKGLDYCPSFSPDGRYLFFTRSGIADSLPPRRLEYEELKALLSGPGNGRGDIFWAPVSVLPL